MSKVASDIIRLQLFPFSLKEIVRTWLHSLKSISFFTWDKLRKPFLAKHFPISSTASMRNQITNFYQSKNKYLEFSSFMCPPNHNNDSMSSQVIISEKSAIRKESYK